MTILINNLTGERVAVTATTEHPDSSYGKAVWVDEEGTAYVQQGMEQPMYSLEED